MSKLITSQEPTISLRGINPILVFKNYKENNYSYITIDLLKNHKFELKKGKSSITNLSNNEFEDVFVDKSRSSNKIYATTNCSVFNSFLKDEIVSTICTYCRKPNKDTYGVPVKHQMLNGIHIFHIITCNCSLECALAEFSDEFNNNKWKGIFTEESRNYILLANELLFPGTKLNPAPHWRLAKWNGGSLEEKEYIINRHSYYNTKNILFFPAKLIFERIKNDV